MRVLLVLALSASAAVAQGIVPGATGPPSPDCYATGSFTATGTAYNWDNHTVGCTSWHLSYTATSNVSALSIEIDAANLGTTAGSAGTFSAMTGIAYGSTNPSTAVTGGEIAAAPFITPAWVQIKLGSMTGTGQVNWVVMGYRPTATTTPGGGFGTFALGYVTSGFPVLATACTQSAVIAATAGAGATIVVTNALATVGVHICGFAISTSLAGTVQFTSGSGAACGGSNTALTGIMNINTAIPMTYGSGLGQVMQSSVNGTSVCVTAVTGNINGVLSYTIY